VSPTSVCCDSTTCGISFGREMQAYIEVQVNGKKKRIPESWMVVDLVKNLKLHDKQIAVEVNEQIIGHAGWADRPLDSGDRIEIVHFVGGGRG